MSVNTQHSTGRTKHPVDNHCVIFLLSVSSFRPHATMVSAPKENGRDFKVMTIVAIMWVHVERISKR